MEISDFSLTARNVSCSKVIGTRTLQIADIHLAFTPETLNILTGDSQSGKDLLFKVLSLIEPPDSGEIMLAGESTLSWSETKRAEIRSVNFGFVFEAPFLLPSFNVLENIAMPLFKLTGIAPEEARIHTERMLGFVGLADSAEYSPEQLPPWAQLRIALARALVIQPVALFVENLEKILRHNELLLFLELLGVARKAFGCCVIVSTGFDELAAYGTHAVELAEGRIVRNWKPGGVIS